MAKPEKKLFTLEEMIRKMTGLSADYLKINGRGYIKDGFAADMIIMDYGKLKDTATYKNPNSVTEGIDCVIVNGRVVYENMKFTGEWPGRMLKHSGQ